ncbi:MAG: tyrosine-type recombinase/integrase [Mycobacteriales bacterium]
MVANEFPEVSSATFWRCVRDVRRADGTPAAAAKQGRAAPAHEPSGQPVGPDPPLREQELALILQELGRRVAQLEIGPCPSFDELADSVRVREDSDHIKPGWGASSEGITVAEAFDRYVDKHLVRLRTGWKQRRTLLPIVERLGRLLCIDVGSDDIAGAVPELIESAPVHARRTLAYFSAFCRWCVDQGLMLGNPARWICPPDWAEPRTRSLSIDELAEVWLAAETLGAPFSNAIQFLILTGCRRDDVANLRESDLWNDDGRRCCNIRERNHGEPRTFALPLSPQAERRLEAAVQARPLAADLIFTTTGATGISGWSKAKRRLDTAIQSRRSALGGAGTPPMAAWRLNDFRRSFAEVGLENLDGAYYELLGRCLNRMTENPSPMARAMAEDSSELELRREIMIAWGALIEGAVARLATAETESVLSLACSD